MWPASRLRQARRPTCLAFAGEVWQVALLDLPVNASRRWPATRGEKVAAGLQGESFADLVDESFAENHQLGDRVRC
jgi:hypothetical protein